MFEFTKPTLRQPPKATNKMGAASAKRPDTSPLVDAGGNQFSSESRGSGPQLGTLDVNLDTSLLLEGMDSDLRDKQLFRVYRDMYWHDPVCGACADTFSVMPFSDFGIGGAPEKFLDDYRETIEVLGMRTAMPQISIDHQVTGAFAGSILYNADDKKIFDLMPHKYENLAIHSMPLYSQDPIRYLTLDEEMKATVRLDSKRMAMVK